MMDFDFLKPSDCPRVMDLVASTGIDVSDWSNFKGGIEKAASNPKYCYEWSFEDHKNKLIVLNLWYDELELSDGKIIMRFNLKEGVKQETSSLRVRRASKMDLLLQKAAHLNWPVRVIIKRKVSGSKSGTEKRLLDTELWYVKSYISRTGDCVLIRGITQESYVDQFELENPPEGKARKRKSNITTTERSREVRLFVLNRAKGCCEWCGERGFKTSSGSIYLETHHIHPISEKGRDWIDNVIALCPNDHRKAHFGEYREQFKKSLFKRMDELN